MDKELLQNEIIERSLKYEVVNNTLNYAIISIDNPAANKKDYIIRLTINGKIYEEGFTFDNIHAFDNLAAVELAKKAIYVTQNIVLKSLPLAEEVQRSIDKLCGNKEKK